MLVSWYKVRLITGRTNFLQRIFFDGTLPVSAMLTIFTNDAYNRQNGSGYSQTDCKLVCQRQAYHIFPTSDPPMSISITDSWSRSPYHAIHPRITISTTDALSLSSNYGGLDRSILAIPRHPSIQIFPSIHLYLSWQSRRQGTSLPL